MSNLSQSKSQLKLRESSARAYDSLFNYGAKKKKSGVSGSGATFEQVVGKVENLMQREAADCHRPLPDQPGQKRAALEEHDNDIHPCNGAASKGKDKEKESVHDGSEVVRRADSEHKAKEIISKESLMCYFSELIENCAAGVIDEKLSEPDPESLTPKELDKAKERGEHRFAHLCDFPLRIVLTPLSRGGRIVSQFAELLEMQFGPLHASLQVGNVILEWNDSSLVVPHFCEPEDPLLQADLQHLSNWAEFTSTQHDKVRKAVTTSDYQKQIELVFHVTAEKHRQLETLVDVIIRYNELYYYNLIDRNCQHFVTDALKALGVEKPINFTGGLGEYFEALKKGRSSSVQAQFASHAELDSYVSTKEGNVEINKMEQNDLEFLLAQYFRFHLEQKSKLQDQNADLRDWACKEPACCMQRLEKQIRFERLRIHNFRAINTL